MELQDQKMIISSQEYIMVEDEEDDETPLPGFRFHPTDEELVTFYLKRKIEKKPFSFELIKQIDIYRYDPWDLAKVGSVGDKEWYFYCKRGRKYKNSTRPNRVTGSGGFWKATGIDRPVYDSNVVNANESRPHRIVGLKKSLVYYRGSAGKGTKTDWMMHEFRLPPLPLFESPNPTNFHLDEAEIWTVCRIFKRNGKYNNSEWRELSSKRGCITSNYTNTSAQSTNNTNEHYISFITPSTSTKRKDNGFDRDIKPWRRQSEDQMIKNTVHCHDIKGQSPSELAFSFSNPLNTLSSPYDDDQCDYDGSYWDDLTSVVDFAITEMYN